VSQKNNPKQAAYDTEAFNRLSRFSAMRKGPAAQTEAENDPTMAEMRKNRRVNAKTANATGRGTSNLGFATGRPRDPLFYWKQNNLPYDTADHSELKKIREYTRLLYQTHPIIASCVDIYSKYPILGSELVCKDEQLTEFYTDLFFTEEGLNYDEFLIDMGREYWTVGEAWPFASFNESLGVWDDEELLNPDDVEVERSPFLKEPRFLIRLPETLRRVLQTRSPAWEYEKLMRAYPELAHYADNEALMPVSSILLRQMKFKGDTFNKRGIPILMRSMRAVMQEEMLNAAMDAIADRLYTPLILVRLGASATDLGTTQPWIPNDDDLADFEEAMDGALAADFRVLVHHFGVQMESVFGRENMPDMGPDFDRLEERILQTFGLSRTMLSGASSGETYAADALNRDLVSQLLTTYQDQVVRHYRQRALVVAEAQEHWDYDVRGGKRYVKMEEVLEIDEETGEERIIEQPKLLIPEMKMKTMNISDEESERQFYESLRAAGVPISMKTRLVNVPIDLQEEIEQTRDEQVELAIAEQETRKAMFQGLRSAGLPIPADLSADFQPVADQANTNPTMGGRTPLLGVDPLLDTPNLAPTPEDQMMVPPDGGVPQPGMPAEAVDAQGGDPYADQSAVPPESTEMMGGMPKPAALHRQASKMRAVVEEHYVAPEGPKVIEKEAKDEEGNTIKVTMIDDSVEPVPTGAWAAPKHVGMRRHAGVNKDTPLDEADEDA
jgi:hypothetical protein